MPELAASQCWGRSAFPVDQPLPPILVLSDLAAILDVGPTRVKELQKRGDFEAWEFKPRIGNVARYSGKQVQAWLDSARDAAQVEEETHARHFTAARRLRMARALRKP